MKGGAVVFELPREEDNHMERGKQMFGKQMFAGPICCHGTQRRF